MANKFVVSFIMNNILFWEKKDNIYNGTVGNITKQFNSRAKFKVSREVVEDAIDKLVENEVIQVKKQKADFGVNLQFLKGKGFYSYAAYYNDTHGKFIKI